MATALLLFYEGPQKRQASRIPAQGGVAVDGTSLTGDSAGLSGVVYEYRAPLNAFVGAHTISFTEPEGQEFADSFSFYTFRLTGPVPEVVKEGDLLLPLAGLPEGSKIRAVLTDTSFAGKGYNELLIVNEQNLVIPEAALADIKNGPVTLHLFWEADQRLSSTLKGHISLSYGLVRQFQLQKGRAKTGLP